MMKNAFVALLTLVLTTGCFEIDQNINLNKDLSGTADFHLGIDFEPMVVIMAQMGREMEGKKGPITKAELDKAKADFKKSQKKSEGDSPADLAEAKAEMTKTLPKGVKLLDFNATEKDFGVATDFKFGFDRLNHLVDIKLPQKKSEDPTQKNVIDTPFEGLEMIEKGDTITIRTKPVNPAEKVNEEKAEGPKLDPETEEMIKKAFSKLRVAYRITAPFTIVSHNATRREGDTLIWEYDMARFEKMAKEKTKPEDMAVRVTYKR